MMLTSSMVDETRVCLNPMPTIPEDEPAPGRTFKYNKLATDEHNEPVSLMCVINVVCILFVTLVLVAAVTLLVILYSDPCVVSICNDFNTSLIKVKSPGQ